MTNLVSCETCKYYCSHEVRDLDGWCHKHAPRVVVGHVHNKTVWPRVKSSEWCGEWDAGKVGGS